jgi:hypothetical protein
MVPRGQWPRNTAGSGKILPAAGNAGIDCHSAPDFIPAPPNPATIVDGIGTSLGPATIPSLRGAWATAPYLHNGSAHTLMDVWTINPHDVHGTLAAVLTRAEQEPLVVCLQTL